MYCKRGGFGVVSSSTIDLEENEMKKVKLLAITAIAAMGLMVGCGKAKDDNQPQQAPKESVVTEDSVKTESMYEEIDMEEEVAKVQATLTYMGGLYVNHDPANDMELAIFRNEEGDIIYIIYELGHWDYGMYETLDKTTDDGRDYAEIQTSDPVYGYYFTDEECNEGILIGADGKVRDAIALDESVARDMVRYTLVGEE